MDQHCHTREGGKPFFNLLQFFSKDKTLYSRRGHLFKDLIFLCAHVIHKAFFLLYMLFAGH